MHFRLELDDEGQWLVLCRECGDAIKPGPMPFGEVADAVIAAVAHVCSGTGDAAG